MSIIGFKNSDTREQQSFTDYYRYCRDVKEITLPLEILEVIIKSLLKSKEERPKEITTTEIIGCLRSSYIKKTTDYYVYPEDLYYIFRGQIVHSILEETKAEIKEKRFYNKINGIGFSGKIDSYNKGVLIDYKTTKQVPKYGKVYPHHDLQLNIYKYLMEKEGIKVNALNLIYISMDSCKKIPVLLREEKEVEVFLVEKLGILHTALKKKEFPSVESYSQWECNYCDEDVKSLCYKVKEGGN